MSPTIKDERSRPLQPNQKTRIRFTNGFSLIELLVAIVVLAILVAILVSGARKAIKNAASARETSNLKQIFTGVALYAADNDNKIMPTDGRVVDPGDAWRWYGNQSDSQSDPRLVTPLMNMLSISSAQKLNEMTIAQDNQTETPVASTLNAYGYPYAVNYNLMVNTVGVPLVRLANLTDPANTILVTDSNRDDWGPGFFHNAGLDRIGSPQKQTLKVLWADGHVTEEDRSHIINNAEEFIAL
jgi:prepilin-type N-terminal cleavage/methylation domain-containing protein